MHISIVAHIHIALVFLHMLALAVGLGAALLADWIVLARMTFTQVSARAVAAVADLSRAVGLGLVGLWATGVALIVFHWQQHAAVLLANEEVWAKLVIVCLLTINAAALHRLVLPGLVHRIGLPLFGPGRLAPLLPTLSGAVSSCSWLFVAYLGVGRELNGVARLGSVLEVYAAALAATWAIGLSLALLGRAMHGPDADASSVAARGFDAIAAS